jgi:hypothetical protein
VVDVVRARLILLVTIAALLAPCLAPCLSTAPGGHAVMPCCQASDSMPTARACCAIGNEQPATPALATALLPNALLPTSALAAPAILTRVSRVHESATNPSSPSRRLSTVLLI